MIKKSLCVALLGLGILAGLLFVTRPSNWLPERNRTQDVPLNQATSAVIVKPAQVTAGDQFTESIQKTPSYLKEMTLKTLKPESQLQTRAERWRLAKNASSLDQSILSLATDADIEAPIFLAYLIGLCSKSVSFTAKDPLQSVINPTGMTYSDVLRSLNKAFDKGLAEETIAKAIALKEEFALRCGKAIDITFTGDALQNASQRSRAAGGVLISSPINSKSFEGEGAAARLSALDKVLRDRDLPPIWLAQRFPIFQEFAEKAGYFDGMNYSEQQAIGWTVICNLGGDCNDNGTTRLDACLTSQLCGGNSVAESVASAIGAEKVADVAARANRLALDLAAAGSDFFKPRSKQ